MEERFEDLKGKTLVRIEGKVGDSEIVFTTDSGDRYKLFHNQD